jgi:uncharacterized protein (TIGR02246 family)
MRNHLTLGLVAIVLMSVVGGCAPPPQKAEEAAAEEQVAVVHDVAADEAALEATTAEWEAAFNAAGGEAIAAIMTEDGMLSPPNAETVSGRQAIQEFWQGFIDIGITAALRLQEVSVSGDLAYKRGEYDLFDAEGEIIDTGKWLEIWTRSDGGWNMKHDMWNSNLPLPE